MGVFGETIDVTSPFFKTLADDQRILVQAVILRLSTRRGTYWDDPEYGLDLSDYVNDGLTEEKLVTLASDIKVEIEKDERIATATVGLAMGGTPDALELIATISVEPTEGDAFSLTLAATEPSVELLTKGEGA